MQLTGKDSQYTEIMLSVMIILCLMLSGIYYVQNYASIIGWCLIKSLETGFYPSNWLELAMKQCNVIPVHKCGSVHDPATDN